VEFLVQLDLLIIGAGPAGLNMGRAAAEAGANYLIIDRDDIAGAWRKLYPGMKMLSPATPHVDWTSLPGLEIWQVGCERPFPTREDFVRYLEAYADKFKLHIKQGAEALSISGRNGKGFDIETNRGKLECRRVIVATGIISNPYIPENLRDKPGVIHSVDFRNPEQFKDKKVLILGSGNSAAEVTIRVAGWASELTLAHPGPLHFHSETKRAEHIRGLSESHLRELFIFDIVRHLPDTILEGYDGKTARLSGHKIEVDAIIAATGFRPHIDFIDNGNIKITRRGHFPALTMKLESASEPGIFFTGSLANIFPYSNFIHGFREDPNGINLRPDSY